MQSSKLVVSAAVVALGLTSVTAGWAKPGNQGNGKSSGGRGISSIARSKQDDGRNHGKTVSEAARSRSGTRSSDRYDDRDDDRYESKTKRTKKSKKIKSNKRYDYKRTRSTDSSSRSASVRQAQSTYQQTRDSILNDGNRNDRLTSTQRAQLNAAIRTRKAAIRATR